MNDPNLFEQAEYASLGDITVEKKERVTYDYWVELKGVKFDAMDLMETLHAVDGGYVTTNFSREKTKLLKELGILKSEGSNRAGISATLGPNAKDFIRKLEEQLDEFY